MTETQLMEGKDYFGSEFEGAVHCGGKAWQQEREAGAHCSQGAEREAGGYSLGLVSPFSSL